MWRIKTIKFIQIEKENKEHYEMLSEVCIPYLKEINFDSKKHKMEPKDLVRLISNIQGNREDMHLELCYMEDNIIGFCFYAVDLGGVKGIIDPGYGYIMEFYVSPEYRLKGYGRRIFDHIEKVFAGHGADNIYLTPQKISGEGFWSSLGFKDSGKIDPDNHKAIYTKNIQK